MAKYPAIPAPRPGDTASMMATIVKMKEVIEILVGQRGAVSDHAVTVGGLPATVGTLPAGTPGKQGDRGPPGFAFDGDDGAASFIPGSAGAAGAQGDRGVPGQDGDDGLQWYGGPIGCNELPFNDPNFFWDYANTRIGLGTQAPTVNIDIKRPWPQVKLNLTDATLAAQFLFEENGASKGLFDYVGSAFGTAIANTFRFGSTGATPVDFYYNSAAYMRLTTSALSMNTTGTGVAADASAMLDLVATTKGALIPRMTTTQRDAITAAEGLLIYNTTTHSFNVYNGTVWRQIDAEGTFTPTVVSSGGGTPTYTTQVGFYTIIGDRVLYNLRIVLATLGTLAAGTVTIGGLPFTSNATTGNITQAALQVNNMVAGTAGPFTSQINAGATTAVFNQYIAATGLSSAITVAMITATFTIGLSGHYPL